MIEPESIVATNLTTAWCMAFKHVLQPGAARNAPLVVTINADGSMPAEDVAVSDAIDAFLEQQDARVTCNDIASTIFPAALTDDDEPAAASFDRWRRAYERLTKRAAKKRLACGRYHQRMVAFGANNDNHGCDQLQRVLDNWNSGNHNPMCFQVSLLDPNVDKLRSRQVGFPCLQQIGFIASQHRNGYKAYGNYKGLCQLGCFMARHMPGCRFGGLVCFVAKTTGARKSDLATVARVVTGHLERHPPNAKHSP